MSEALNRLREAHKNNQVIGLKDVSGIQPRLDIDVLMKKDPDAFNLFVLAFAELKKDHKSPMGFFEVAGIHGLPKRKWNGVEGKLNVPGGPQKNDRVNSGYCAHSMATFPTWHRAYLTMMEQSIFLKMLDIAETKYEKAELKDKYTKAAYRFRLPYWDYFRPRGGPVTFDGVFDNKKTAYPYDFKAPILFTSDIIMVRTYPDDVLEQLKGGNPFFQFEFPTEKDVAIPPEDWAQVRPDTAEELADITLFPRTHTVRYPKFGDISSTASLNRVLNNMRMDSNRLALTMIGDDVYKKYDYFSCNDIITPNPPNKTENAKFMYGYPSGSLETLHNIYHVLIGGAAALAGGSGGHLSRVPCAAFDPIFWYHHGQIERIFSLWQAVHSGEPDEWFSEETMDLAKQDLLPFRQNGTDYWKSTKVQSTKDLGYTYEEIQGSKTDVLKTVRGLYEWSVPLDGSPKIGPIPTSMKPIIAEESDFFKGIVHTTSQPESEFDEESAPALTAQLVDPSAVIPKPADGYTREWYIDDQVQRLALNGAFTIFYYISANGSAPGSGSNLVLQGTLAGVNHVFAAPVEICDNCQRQEQQAEVVTSTSAITSQLLDYVQIGELESLEPEHVVPYLKKNLKWRILTVNGGIVDPRDLARDKGYEVGVTCKKARLPRDSGDVEYIAYPEIFQAIIGQASVTANTFA